MNAWSHAVRRRPRTASAGAAMLAVLFVGAACNPFAFPGLTPLSTPPAVAIDPEPVACGAQRERPVVATPLNRRIIGAADFHNHQFANLGFGGRVVWGSSYDERGMAHALSACGAEGLCIDDDRERLLCREVFCRLRGDLTACRRMCDRRSCGESPPHGHFGFADPVNAVLGRTPGHFVDGYPSFKGWPHWNTYTHQQVYHRWLRRAFDGGLKLIVMHAVTNEVLCKLQNPDFPCDDMSNVDRQLAAAYQLEETIDRENDCTVNGNGWYRIAETPQEAREIIAGGAMAVVLAIEVDTLFNCYAGRPCKAEEVVAAIEKYRAKGVRHVFPVHLFDNAFGGTAASADFFNFGNVVINHELLGVRDCAADDYTFKFDESSEVRGVLSGMAATLGVSYPKYPEKKAHCNTLGLTPAGEVAIRELMKAKMIVDVDHMSALTRARTFGIAEQCGAKAYPGLVSSHSGFTEVAMGQKRHEGQLTAGEVKRLVDLGGLLAPILNQGGLEEVAQYPAGDGSGRPTIAADCGHSAKSFAQAYRYAVEHARRADGGPVAVGFGSDVNGLAGMPTPRFGPYACGGERSAAQTGRVNYPIQLYKLLGVKPFGEPMPASQAGYRTFDINVDGFAHIGMFPDFVAELEAIGLEDELEPLFNSAEAYIELWENAEAWTPCEAFEP